jgi:hypothetical protein
VFHPGNLENHLVQVPCMDAPIRARRF